MTDQAIRLIVLPIVVGVLQFLWRLVRPSANVTAASLAGLLQGIFVSVLVVGRAMTLTSTTLVDSLGTVAAITFGSLLGSLMALRLSDRGTTRRP